MTLKCCHLMSQLSRALQYASLFNSLINRKYFFPIDYPMPVAPYGIPSASIALTWLETGDKYLCTHAKVMHMEKKNRMCEESGELIEFLYELFSFEAALFLPRTRSQSAYITHEKCKKFLRRWYKSTCPYAGNDRLWRKYEKFKKINFEVSWDVVQELEIPFKQIRNNLFLLASSDRK